MQKETTVELLDEPHQLGQFLVRLRRVQRKHLALLGQFGSTVRFGGRLPRQSELLQAHTDSIGCKECAHPAACAHPPGNFLRLKGPPMFLAPFGLHASMVLNPVLPGPVDPTHIPLLVVLQQGQDPGAKDDLESNRVRPWGCSNHCSDAL